MEPSDITKGLLWKVADIVSKVSYDKWLFTASIAGDRVYIQGRFIAPDSSVQHTRKWYISCHSTRNEIVQTCLKLVLTAAEHEVRETFKYKGEAIYSPHFDPDLLVELCKLPHLDYRTNKK